MAGFLSKLHLRPQNRKTAASSRQKSVWTDENDPRITYHLRPRAKRVSIKMDAARRAVIVAVPGHERQLGAAKKFVREKYDWILVQLETLPPAQPFVDGGTIMFKGEPYRLASPSPRGRPYVDEQQRLLVVPAPEGTLEGRTKRFLIREARTALTMCTQVHAGTLGKAVDKISVRDTSSRWGSCKKGGRTSGGQIAYSWRLVCAPPYVLDYVAAHECAHLVHADHSKNFWGLCDELVDTVKPAKRWLNQHGARLHAVGADF